MASNSINVYAPASPSKYPYTLGVNSSEIVTDELTKNNKTLISASATLYGKNIRFDGTGGTLAIWWFDNNKNQNGALIASQTIATPSMGVTYSASGTLEVEHDDDGKLSGYAKAVWTKTSSNSYVPPTSNVDTGWFNLTSIARSTKLTEQTGTIGEAMNIAWTKANVNFTHKLTYSFGGKTGTIGTDLVDNVEWTPPTSLYSVMAGKNGEGTLSLTTYNGDTQIGSTQTAKITLNAKQANVEPTIVSRAAKDINETTKALTGNASILVFYKSNTQLDIVFNTREYATASKLVVNNVEYEIPTGVLQSDKKTTKYTVSLDLGTTLANNFNIVITDSRGFQKTDLIINEFVNYIPLKCSTVVKRITPTSGKVGATFNGNYFSGSFGKTSNSLSIKYKFKKRSEETYSNPISLTNNTDYKISGNKFYSGNGSEAERIELSATFNYRYVYDGILYVEDKLTTLAINFIVIKGVPIFWWNKEKVVVNGELHIADSDGNNEINVKENLSELLDNVSELSEEVTNLNQNTKPSFAQMWTNGSVSLTTQVKVNIWTGGTTIQEGDFVCEQANGRIKIPAGSAKSVEIFAHSAGGDYALIDLRLTNGTSVWQNRTIFQSGGNKYWSQPVANMIVSIQDTTQDSYLEMYAGGYNSTFLLNSGFGNQATFMGVRKLS